MASLFEDIQAALVGCAAPGGAWYAVNTSEVANGPGTSAPFIVWQRIVSTDNVSLLGPSNLQNTRFQVDVFAPRIADAVALMDTVEAAMLAAPISAIPVSSQDLYEEPVKLFRISRDFSAWR